MTALLLDTTVLIDLLRDRPAGQRLRLARAQGDALHTSTVNVEEVYRGLREEEENEARRLFAGLRVVTLGREEGARAGIWRRHFARVGVTLQQSDCLIAAAAVTAGGRLATGNPRDFPMAELTVEHWPVGA